MFIDKGLNDHWVRPRHLRRVGRGRYAVTVKEPLWQLWETRAVSYPLPRLAAGAGLQVCWNEVKVPCQISGNSFSFPVEGLQPGEERVYQVAMVRDAPPAASPWLQLAETAEYVEAGNGLLAIRMPAGTMCPAETHGQAVPGPLLAVRRGEGAWLGQGRLESPILVTAYSTRVTETGPLWATLEVTYAFADGSSYRVQFVLYPQTAYCEVREESTLPVRLWPAPRPYREIGSLGVSHWGQGVENIGKPCLRPCPTSNVIFDLRAGFAPDRLVTHSTASWEIMDLPLGAAGLRTYTAMRPALPSIDGGWLGVYDSRREELFGALPLDICHWQTPDEMIHPAHRTPGANSEVILVDGADQGLLPALPHRTPYPPLAAGGVFPPGRCAGRTGRHRACQSHAPRAGCHAAVMGVAHAPRRPAAGESEGLGAGVAGGRRLPPARALRCGRSPRHPAQRWRRCRSCATITRRRVRSIAPTAT